MIISGEVGFFGIGDDLKISSLKVESRKYNLRIPLLGHTEMVDLVTVDKKTNCRLRGAIHHYS